MSIETSVAPMEPAKPIARAEPASRLPANDEAPARARAEHHRRQPKPAVADKPPPKVEPPRASGERSGGDRDRRVVGFGGDAPAFLSRR